jgi:HlyD family secretion protein
MINEVKFGDFQDIIAVNGVVEPIRTVQIAANEGGRVEEIFVEDGVYVEEGTPLMRLSNATLTLDFMNRETQIIEQMNNLRSTRITLDQNKRQIQEQLLEISHQYLEQKRQYKIDSTLYAQGAIATTQYDEMFNQLVYLTERRAMLEDRMETDEQYRTSQLGRIDQSIELMERNLDAIRMNLENLIIKAPISGQISQFDHEIGETKNRGENLGRVDVMDDFLISAPIDQYYLNRVQTGQKAVAELNGRAYSSQVSKVFPAVEAGQFEVHLKFDSIQTDTNLRRGQNARVKLELSAKEKALMLKRGGFFQSTGGKYVFVVSNEGKAVKRSIELGSQNPDYIKVLSGLEEGDKVITSSYDDFGDAEVIYVNE